MREALEGGRWADPRFRSRWSSSRWTFSCPSKHYRIGYRSSLTALLRDPQSRMLGPHNAPFVCPRSRLLKSKLGTAESLGVSPPEVVDLFLMKCISRCIDHAFVSQHFTVLESTYVSDVGERGSIGKKKPLFRPCPSLG